MQETVFSVVFSQKWGVNITKDFWAEVIKWFDNQGVKIEHLSHKDIMFGILRCEDELFINHTLVIANQYLYSCRQNNLFLQLKYLTPKLK